MARLAQHSIPNRIGVAILVAVVSLLTTSGCSITRSRLATEQLVVSDAVDAAIAQVDFSPLSGQKVFFDTKYLNNARLPGNSNVEYVISSLRQQMLAYDLRLTDKMEDAAIVVEARVGTLGTDGNEVTYGIPGNAALSTAALFLSSPFSVPAMPELSLGRRNHQWGAAKLGVFAYDRATHERLWQAGVSTGSSDARDLWVFGLGPFHRGRTYGRFRGNEREGRTLPTDGSELAEMTPEEAYASQIDFRKLSPPAGESSETVATPATAASTTKQQRSSQ